MHIRAAKMGVWISLDDFGGDIDYYVDALTKMKENGLLQKVLLSHDAGWYRPEETNGGHFRGFTAIFKILIPQLKEKGFSAAEIEQLLIKNPSEALKIKKG